MMTKIKKYLKRFEAYQNGDLNPPDAQAFIKALEQDQEMHDAWIEYLDMMDAFSDKEAVSLRSTLENAFYKQQTNRIRFISQNVWFRISAAAIVIVVMGALLYFFCSNKPEFWKLTDDTMLVVTDSSNINNSLKKDSIWHDTAVAPNKPQIVGVAEMQIASIYDNEQYQISPVFAELLHNVYRSGWFRITTPEDSMMFSPGDSLMFSWETNIENALYFDVLDRNGQVVYKHPDSISSPWVYTPKLSPAIYMFRFATENEPVWMGVIVGG